MSGILEYNSSEIYSPLLLIYSGFLSDSNM